MYWKRVSSLSVLFPKPRVKLILAAIDGMKGSMAALTNLIALAATNNIVSDLCLNDLITFY